MILQSLFTAIKLLLISNRTIRFDSVSSSEQNYYMAAANGHSYDDAQCRIKKESGIVRIRTHVATTSTSRKDASRDFTTKANDRIRADV